MKLRVSYASGALIFEKDYPFTTVTIGRGDKALCRIDDVRVSKLHLALKQEGEWFLVKDLDSQNGTKFENHLLTEKRLQPPFCLLLSDSVMIDVSLSNSVSHALPPAVRTLSQHSMPVPFLVQTSEKFLEIPPWKSVLTCIGCAMLINLFRAALIGNGYQEILRMVFLEPLGSMFVALFFSAIFALPGRLVSSRYEILSLFNCCLVSISLFSFYIEVLRPLAFNQKFSIVGLFLGILALWAQQLLSWYPFLASFFSVRTRNRVLIASSGIALVCALGIARSNLLISREDFLAENFESTNPRYIKIFNSQTMDPSQIEQDLVEFSQ